jgi:aldehyde dehydrogenase (NAD+)
VAERQRDRVEGYIAKGISDDARLVAGGGRPAGLDQGWFVEPTIFADVDNKSVIAQEEIFGPVWTTDPDHARRVIRRVRTGTMGINDYMPDPAGPWGGVKARGLGRELGPGAVAAYQNLKTVYA